MKLETSKWTVAAMLAGAVLVGCNKEEPTATPPAKTETSSSTATTKPSMPTTMPAVVSNAVDAAKNTAMAAKDTAIKDATAKLDEITGLIKDKKFDLADSGLKKLEDNKAALPEVVAGKLPDIRKALDAAKLMNTAVKVPEVPKATDVKLPEVPNLNK